MPPSSSNHACRVAVILSATVAIALLLPSGAAIAGSRDGDNDRLPDRWERHVGLSTTKHSAAGDPDHDGLRNRREMRLRLHPRRRDTDRDRLSDGYEVRRSRTNPRHRDTDRDGLSDGFEVLRSKTNPRRRDSDGDGVSDADELRALEAARRKPRFVDTTPPDTVIVSGPAASTTDTAASFTFTGADNVGVAGYDCQVDASSWTACSSPKSLSGLTVGTHTFSVRAKDGKGNVDPTPATRAWTITSAEPPPPPPPPSPTDGPFFYVDRDSRGGACSDSHTAAQASAAATPWCTLARAADAAPAPATVLVRGGSYPAFQLRGSRTSALAFRPYTGETATLVGGTLLGDHVRLEGFRITGTVKVDYDVGNIALVGNDWITDGRSGDANLGINAGAHDVLVENNRIGHVAGIVNAPGIDFNSVDTWAEIVNVTIRNNRIGPIPGGGDAIQAKHTRNLLIEDNEFFGITLPPGGDGHPDVIQSIYGAIDMTLRRNFIHDISAQGIAIDDFMGPNRNFVATDNVIARVAYPWVAWSFDVEGATLQHNTIDGYLRFGGTNADLFANISTSAIDPYPDAQITRENYNLSQRYIRTPGVNSLVGAPTYRNSGANDFTLATGSLGKGAAPDGSDLGSRLTVFETR